MCFLETAANPYVAALGDDSSAPRRLNLAQSFNGLGAFVAAMFLSKLGLSGNTYTRETLPAGFEGGWEGYIQMETDAMKLPYLILAAILIIIAVAFIFVKLPKIKEEEEGKADDSKLIDFSVLKKSHLRWGVIAQFFYNGGQTAVNSLFLVYCCNYAGLSESTATTFFGLYMLAFLLGRWIGTALMIKSDHSAEAHDYSAENDIDDGIDCKHVLRLELYHQGCTDPSSEKEGKHVKAEECSRRTF